MSRANSGHTDKATINARRPITENMRATLQRIADEPKNAFTLSMCSTALKNQIRALVNRGYCKIENNPPGYHAWDECVAITAAGRAALSPPCVPDRKI